MTAQSPKVEPNQEEEPYKNPKWLTFLVVGMGIAIVVMVGIIITKVVSNAMSPSSEEVSKTPVEASVALPPSTPAAAYLTELDAPENAVFVDIAGGGADAMFRFRHADGSWTVIVFDTRKGVERGRIKFD